MFKVPEEHRERKHPMLRSDSSFGNNGFFVIPHYKITGYEVRVQASCGMGWEHCSVTIAPKKGIATRCPTWQEMCFVKNVFWGEEDVVVQFHPAKTDYVNCHEFCLHLWRSTDHPIFTPPSILVGPKT